MDVNFNDEHSGKGGSYVRDADGKRVLQERTDHTRDTLLAQPAEPVAVAAPAKNKSTNVKGASNA